MRWGVDVRNAIRLRAKWGRRGVGSPRVKSSFLLESTPRAALRGLRRNSAPQMFLWGSRWWTLETVGDIHLGLSDFSSKNRRAHREHAHTLKTYSLSSSKMKVTRCLIFYPAKGACLSVSLYSRHSSGSTGAEPHLLCLRQQIRPTCASSGLSQLLDQCPGRHKRATPACHPLAPRRTLPERLVRA